METTALTIQEPIELEAEVIPNEPQEKITISIDPAPIFVIGLLAGFLIVTVSRLKK